MYTYRRNYLLNIDVLCVKDIVKHVTKNPIYVFPEIKLRGFIPNSYNHVYVSNLYIPMVGLPIWLQQNRQTTGRQLTPFSSVLYGIISKRRSVLAAQLLLREKSAA
jgi:hypothetical protein